MQLTARWRCLTLTHLRSAGTTVCVVLLLPFVVALVSAALHNGQTVLGPRGGRDFTAFYMAGTLVNTHGLAALYTLSMQAQTYYQLFPQPMQGLFMPYLNPPFLALLFALLAHLPYWAAYLIWTSLSLLGYILSYTLLWRSLGLPREQYATGLLIALSFIPFLLDNVLGGQTATLGFSALAVAIVLERHGRQVLSGLALALLTYKPTLLLLLLPMLLVTRRWRTLAGWCGGSLLLLTGTGILCGWEVLVAWGHTMHGAGQQLARASMASRFIQFVDLNALLQRLLGQHVLWHWLALSLCGAAGLWCLWPAWTQGAGQGARTWQWGVTIAWMPVLNVYYGIYDVTLLVIGVMVLVAHAQHQTGSLRPALLGHLLLLYTMPWVSHWVAAASRIQIYSLVLAAFGMYVCQVNSEIETKRRRQENVSEPMDPILVR